MASALKTKVRKLDAGLKADVLLIPVVVQKGRPQTPALPGLAGALKSRVQELQAGYHGSSEVGAIDCQHSPARLPVRSVAFVCLGKNSPVRSEDVRVAAGTAIKWCAKNRRKRVCVSLDALLAAGSTVAASAWVEGTILGSYRYDRMKSKRSQPAPSVRSHDLVSAKAAPDVVSACREAAFVADAVNETRTLGHEPPNVINPVSLAERAKTQADSWGLKCSILNEKKLRDLGMGAMLAVGGGSATKPRLIVLEHPGKNPKSAPVVLVGKAITMDTGGISIKPAESIPSMKYDKQGGMTVMGVMKAVAALNLPQRVVGVVAAAENMLSSTAYRPGDILTAMNGTTIEVMNTDAEGRLVLADALHYAETKYEPAVMIDLATLTGAIMVALGDHAAGLFTPHDALAEELVAAGETTSERLWRMPLWKDYRKQIVGTDSDIKNTGGRKGGAITAAMFLKEFVTPKTPWAHLDVAGTAFTDRSSPLWPAGATGFGVRMLVEFIRNRS